MNKIQSQEEFFNHLRSFVTQNDITRITENKIYSFLITFGISKENNDKSPELTQRFNENYLYYPLKSTSGAEIIKDNSFYWLCRGSIDAKSAIKLYVTLDANHIEKGSLEIFKFLNKESIKHQSKIRGKKTTIDNIVVRLDNFEDSQKLSNFIKNNQYIQEGLNNPNPFLVTDNNGVSYGLDGLRVSVNGEIARHIYNYVKTKVLIENGKVIKSELNNISRDDFYRYLHNLDNDYDKKLDVNDQNHNILKLLLKSESPDYKPSNFERYVKTRKELIDKSINRKDILAFAVKVLANKYGIEKTKEHLSYYLNKGDISAFSRDNNTREMINLYISKEEANKIINEYNGIDNYLKNIGIYSDKDKLGIIISSSLTTIENYNQEQLKGALIKIINNNDYSSITRNKNARQILKSNVSSQDVLRLIKNYLNVEYTDNNQLIKEFVHNLMIKYMNKTSKYSK